MSRSSLVGEPGYISNKFGSLERINSIRETNESLDSWSSCKLLRPSRLLEFHESKLPFASRLKFIRSKLSNSSALVPGVALSELR